MKFIIQERDTHPVIKKQDVFITGHPADMPWFRTIANDVLDLWDCKVYVDAEPQQSVDRKDRFLSLGEMNLVILLITENFLMTENTARDVDFPFLMDITIVPLMARVMKTGFILSRTMCL